MIASKSNYPASTQEAFSNWSEEISPDSSISNSSTNDSSSQLQKIESLRKQLEQKNEVIQNLAQTNDRITRVNEQDRITLNQEREALIIAGEQRAEAEADNFQLERDLARYRSSIGQQIVASVYTQNREESSFYQRAREGVSSVGTFCRNHHRAFEAAFSATGAGLAFAYPQYAMPIVLIVTGVVAFFEWLTSDSNSSRSN